MSTPKIRLLDDPALRAELDLLCAGLSQPVLCAWAVSVAKRALFDAGIDLESVPAVKDGFSVNEAWRRGEARMHDVRQAGFAVHAVAREFSGEKQAALRCAGQAVGTGHMREHALVCADYAVKAVNLRHPGDHAAASRERARQIAELREVLK